ncbi:hypothetical protein F0225_11595 [Vibrio pectenicida]|uniref:Uncharacterized protein n=1 Tax=Vibrio pectenicida TaxID=62763 RepID=A0A7Y4EDS2_9VIBR|nr:hypothetical protein [Vibrio pectenicida]NOH71975.1 hypothetical protein [Vibrio pectenicida]
MNIKNKEFIFFSIEDIIIPQELDSEDFGEVARELIKQKAILLPVICHAESDRHAVQSYKDKIISHSILGGGNNINKIFRI